MEKNLSRRAFVAAAVSAMAGAGGLAACSPSSNFAFAEEAADAPRTLEADATCMTFSEDAGEWKKNHCACCSYQNCGLEIHVVDGVAIEVRGNAEHPVNKGALCPRSSSSLMTLYNPYRVKAPLKRTNPNKGFDEDPEWMEVSWEEALDECYEHFSNAVLTNPDSFAFQYGFSGGSLERNLLKATTMICGSSNFLFSCGPLCEIHYSAFRFGGNHLDKPDLEHARYVVDFGRSIGGSVMYASGPARVLTEALQDGLELIVINPHQTPEASKGEWVPIKPSTDYAMLMAIAEVMLCELDEFDKQAAKERTNAPYLIDEAGLYVRDAEGKPMIWDLSDDMAKPFDAEIGDAALEGSFEVDGAACRPALAAIKESVAEATPEWASEKTTVPADTIRRIATDLVQKAGIGETDVFNGVEMPVRHSVIVTGRGCTNSAQGRRAYWLANVINTLLGSTGCPGGIQASTDKAYMVDPDGMFEPTGMITQANDVALSLPTPNYSMTQYFPMAVFPSVFSMATAAIIDPEAHHMQNNIECMYFYGTNGPQSNSKAEFRAEAYRKVPFIFMHALTLDEQSVFCDVVLADTAHHERLHFSTIGDMLAGDQESFSLVGGTNFSYPAVDPVYDARMPEDTFLEFYHRMGPAFTATANTFFGVLAGNPGLVEDPTVELSFAELMGLAANFKAPDGQGEAYFKEHGFAVNPLPANECYDYNETWLGQHARHHVYDYPKLAIGNKLRSEYERLGIEMPGWEGNMDTVYAEYIATPKWIDNFITEDNEEFPLLAVNWKVSCRNLGEAMADSNPWLREVIEDWTIDDFCIQLNPATAEKYGIADGDTIRVTSQHGGVVEYRCKTTNLLHPDAVGFPHSGNGKSMHASPLTRKGVNYNELLTEEPGYYIPDSGCMYNAARVKIEKA